MDKAWKCNEVIQIHVDIKALALIHVAATIDSHVNNNFLVDLPNSSSSMM